MNTKTYKILLLSEADNEMNVWKRVNILEKTAEGDSAIKTHLPRIFLALEIKEQILGNGGIVVRIWKHVFFNPRK